MRTQFGISILLFCSLLTCCARQETVERNTTKSDPILKVEVSDAGELTVNGQRTEFEELEQALDRGLAEMRLKEIHYYSGKLLLDLDTQVNQLLTRFSSDHGVTLKLFPAQGQNHLCDLCGFVALWRSLFGSTQEIFPTCKRTFSPYHEPQELAVFIFPGL